MAAAIQRLERHHMPSRLAGPARQLLEAIAPELPLAARLAVKHLWLTEALVCRLLERHPATAALVRTTAAVTRLTAGEKANVLPAEARATVDLRLRPGDAVQTVVEHVRAALNDLDISFRVLDMHEASAVADAGAEGFQEIARAIRAVFPDAAIAPGLVVMTTDARHYRPLASAAYGFAPLRLDRASVARIHGVNERIGVDNYAEAIRFYEVVLRGAAGAGSPIRRIHDA
jgi:carboxypeptidase PM20D1